MSPRTGSAGALGRFDGKSAGAVALEENDVIAAVVRQRDVEFVIAVEIGDGQGSRFLVARSRC